MAENQPAESFLDRGNRGFFAESGGVDLSTSPNAEPAAHIHADRCRPYHDEGRLVDVSIPVSCQDINWTEDNPDIQFTVLGSTFRPRKAMDKYGRVSVNFSPAGSRDALKAMRQTIRGWRQYDGHVHGSALKPVWRRVNRSLIGWLMRKHKKLAAHKTRAAETLKRLAQRQPRAFVHWSMGYLS